MTGAVPAPLTTLVGRDEPYRRLASWLDEDERLVVTVVGAPGTGKSRLAQELAWDRFQKGRTVRMVDLGEADGADELRSRLGRALDVPLVELDGSEGSEDLLGRALSGQRVDLLVLDNAESSLDSLCTLVERWRALAPELRVLITSRELLRVAGERVLELDPLPTPEPTATTDELRRAPAVQLLLSRAVGYELDERDLPALGALARAVDGIPLALELAAARLALLGPAPLAERMAEPLEALEGAAFRDKGPRATIAGAIDWSWSLLREEERRALAACSVFSGAFSLEAAEAVVAERDVGPSLTLLTSLRDKSLLQTTTGPELLGERRLALYASIRAYAERRLAERPELERQSRRRHIAYYADAGWRRSREVRGPNGAEALRRLAAGRENIDGALAYARALLGSEPEARANGATAASANERAHLLRDEVRLLLAYEPLESTAVKTDHHIEWLREAGARLAATHSPDISLRVEALLRRGRLLSFRGRAEEAHETLDEALQVVERRERSEPALAAAILGELGALEQGRGALDRAEAFFERADVCLGDQDAPRVRAELDLKAGLLHHGRGRLPEAMTRYLRALTTFQSLEDGLGRARAEQLVGSVRLQQARLAEAREHFERALRLLSDFGDRRDIALVLGNLGILEQERGDGERARERYDEALDHVRAIGDRGLEGHLLGYIAACEQEWGHRDAAQELYEEALGILRTLGDRRLLGVFAAARGSLEASRDRLEAAEESLQEAERALVEVADPGLLAALDLHRGQLDLARAVRARHRGDHVEAEALWNDARRRVERFQQDHAQPAATELIRRSDDVRFARRLLERRLEADALVVDEPRGQVRAPGREAVDLSTRVPVRRVLLRLAELRETSPGVALPSASLLEAGWPGEAFSPDAGANRLQVALSTLRKLGLKDYLLRSSDGYLLDPKVPLRLRRDRARDPSR